VAHVALRANGYPLPCRPNTFTLSPLGTPQYKSPQPLAVTSTMASTSNHLAILFMSVRYSLCLKVAGRRPVIGRKEVIPCSTFNSFTLGCMPVEPEEVLLTASH
jgi:hypothetical protein